VVIAGCGRSTDVDLLRERLGGRRRVKLEARRRMRCEGGGGSPKIKNLMKAKRRTARENWPRKKANSAFIFV
jgi:hypothetical protein